MRKLLFMGFLMIGSCTMQTPERLKAESAVKYYLDSLNKPDKYELIGFNSFHSIYTDYNDDPNYDRLKYNRVKADSIRKYYKPQVRAWIIYVRYRGKDGYGNFGTHTYQCALDKKISKCIVGIEVGN
jgi:hypothetical protein